MLASAQASHVARPFAAVLTSNVPGDYPPDQWADITTQLIVAVSDNASDERKSKAKDFISRVREILIQAFQTCQEHEQKALADLGTARYAMDLDINALVIEASSRVIQAAKDTLQFGAVNLGTLFYEPNRRALCDTIGRNLATSVSITRRWHAHAREDDPVAKQFLGVQ